MLVRLRLSLSVLSLIDIAGGKLHQEIFMFQRAKSGKYKDHIWEQVVQPVIKRWGEFVEEHVALPP